MYPVVLNLPNYAPYPAEGYMLVLTTTEHILLPPVFHLQTIASYVDNMAVASLIFLHHFLQAHFLPILLPKNCFAAPFIAR